MISLFVDYATPSVLESDRDRSLLGLTASARRPVRFHGRVKPPHVFLLRTALRALGEAIWSNDTWESAGAILDPVITVHPDRVFFEAFSQDQSVYAMLIADPALFEPEGAMQTGTTNIDFTAWLWASLGEMRSSRETWMRVGAEGFEVQTRGAGGRFQQKVDLPDPWVRGFLQLQGAMAMPGTRLSVRPVDLLSAIRFLRYTKAKLSPRSLRYEMQPGEDARIVLEPWEHTVRLVGAEHNYTELRTIRTWGRRRLALLEAVLPFAERVEIYLKGRGLPSFYAVRLPGGLTFVLGLSGWTGQTWSESGSFDLLSDPARADDALAEAVRLRLAQDFALSPKALAETLGRPLDEVWAACERLCRLGRAIFDVETRRFRHRELFEQPIDEAKLNPPDRRREFADAMLRGGRTQIESCEPQETRKLRRLPSPAGPVLREVVHRDWRVKGTAGGVGPAEIVVNETGRIIFGTCECAFFQEHLLGRGPCEHMIAIFRASATQRRDEPSSLAPSASAMAAAEARHGPKDSAEDEEEADEEDVDEEEEDQDAHP
ncbi:MAG: hypothetical protein QOE70_6006 [Chthoniobacter sp.]|jgi:hypothetical protein|nr:hypothetical protein [Chthoniobacter sp.]